MARSLHPIPGEKMNMHRILIPAALVALLAGFGSGCAESVVDQPSP